MFILWLSFLGIFSLSNASLQGQNQRLLEELFSDHRWETIFTSSNGWKIARKSIPNSSIDALSVSGITDVPPKAIVQVLQEVNRYNQFLRAKNRLKAKSIAITDSAIIGYQRWLVPIWNDRTLVFAMKVVESPQNTLAFWTLLPQNEDKRYTIPQELFQNSVRMTYGAGYWECKPLPNGKTQLTHRVFMDPSGHLPSFLINYINKRGLLEQVEDVVQEAKRRGVN